MQESSNNYIRQKSNNHTQKMIKIDNKVIKDKSSVKLLGVQIDAGKFQFTHYQYICRSAANQLHAFKKFWSFAN